MHISILVVKHRLKINQESTRDWISPPHGSYHITLVFTSFMTCCSPRCSEKRTVFILCLRTVRVFAGLTVRRSLFHHFGAKTDEQSLDACLLTLRRGRSSQAVRGWDVTCCLIICRGFVVFRGRPARSELQKPGRVSERHPWCRMDQFSGCYKKGTCRFGRDCYCELKMRTCHPGEHLDFAYLVWKQWQYF